MGLEPTSSVWKTEVIPIYDSRMAPLLLNFQLPDNARFRISYSHSGAREHRDHSAETVASLVGLEPTALAQIAYAGCQCFAEVVPS